PVSSVTSHFETLHDYDSEIPEHIRQYLLDKKVRLQCEQIHARCGTGPLKVLDIGCGTGWHLHEMTRRGHDTHGVDISARQCQYAIINNPDSADKISK